MKDYLLFKLYITIKSKTISVKKIKIALIGFGYWGVNLARVIDTNLNCELVTIIEQNKEKHIEIKNQYPDCYIHTDIKSMLTIPGLTAVVVSTPVETHFEVVEFCLQNNLHVLCEKVLCSQEEKVDALINLSIEKELILDVDYTFLHNNIVLYIQQLISSQKIGKINYLTFKRTGLGPIRQDVNVIFDLLAHDISIILHWLGMPQWVIATERCLLDKGKSDVAFIQMGYPDGTIADFQVSWLNPMKQRVIEVVGEKSMLIFDDTNPLEKLKIIHTNSDYQSMATDFGSFQVSLKGGDILIPNIPYPEPLKEKLNSFVSMLINNDSSKRMETLEVIRTNTLVLEAIRQSSNLNSKKVFI